MLLSGEIARTAAHGLKGGVTAVIQGGKFEHGMYSAAFSSLGGSVAQPGDVISAACIGAVLGGTAEEIGGGKFANGAVTGAFTVLFNDYLHPMMNDGHSNPLTKCDTRQEMLQGMKSIAEQYHTESGGIEVEVDDRIEFYILPKNVYNNGTTSIADPKDYPYGLKANVIANYHLHLSNNEPSQYDSYSAYRTSGVDYMINKSSVYFIIPHAMPPLYGTYGNRIANINDWLNGNFIGIKH